MKSSLREILPLTFALGCASSATGSETDMDSSVRTETSVAIDVKTEDQMAIADAAISDRPDAGIADHLDAQTTDRPDSAAETLRLELLTAGRRMLPGRTMAIIAAVRRDSSNVLTPRATLQARLDGGDGFLLNSPGREEKRVYMSAICHATSSTQPHNRDHGYMLPQSSSSQLGRFTVVAHDVPCPVGYTDTGFYVTSLLAPRTVERDQSQPIRITDLSRGPTPLEATAAVIVTRGMPETLDTLQVVPGSLDVARNTDIPVLVLPQTASGLALPCSATDATDTNIEAGCSEDRNGGVRFTPAETININTTRPQADRAGAINASTLSSLFIHSRSSMFTSNQPWAFTQVGPGAYMMTTTTANGPARGEFRVESYDRDGVPLSEGLVQINIIN